MQSASKDDLVLDVETLVSLIGKAITLHPGDIMVTGAPSGIGHARKPPLYMQTGDVCRVERLRILKSASANEFAMVAGR